MTKKVYRILIPTLTFFYLWLALGGLDQAAKLWLKLVIIAIGAFLSLLWIRMVRLPDFRWAGICASKRFCGDDWLDISADGAHHGVYYWRHSGICHALNSNLCEFAAVCPVGFADWPEYNRNHA